MEHPKYTIIWLIYLSIIAISCNKEEIDIDAREAILGKWEVIEVDGEPYPADGYTEYLNDSSYRSYDYLTGDFSYGDYYLNDSMLIYYYYTVDIDEIDTISIRYYYSFEDQRTLILDIDALAILYRFVYRKIE
ncbi:MAG: hypothetical protein RLO81_17235 [Fulvivirga sp.]|uniref:hypothetical protein n=1 Tax=Fulvivirga sp. TaxID=1931237 RepID=UPI0032ED3222